MQGIYIFILPIPANIPHKAFPSVRYQMFSDKFKKRPIRTPERQRFSGYYPRFFWPRLWMKQDALLVLGFCGREEDRSYYRIGVGFGV